MAVLRGGYDLEPSVDDVIDLIMGPPEGAEVDLDRLEALYWARRSDFMFTSGGNPTWAYRRFEQ
jgi:hypothetical protein